ncbi:MAG: hypothetical protein WCR52_16530 [Bacteroidota bacterium]
MMKSFAYTLSIFFFVQHVALAQVELSSLLKSGQKIKVNIPKITTGSKKTDDQINNYIQKSPISTTFDDAIYEVPFLKDFEPDENAYRALYAQPTEPNGAFRLKSGLYSMEAKSFCLRGYSHGPSKGDGHLLALMKGKKAKFVQAILERYSQKPFIPQHDVQVILWAIIAGADTEQLGTQYGNTLHQLFTPQELLLYQGKDMVAGVVKKQLQNQKQQLLNNIAPQIQEIMEAESRLRNMVMENRSFQEIEKLAIIAGAAPADQMIREVSKGRWSYHPDGYFIRFFPQGYQRTKVDIFVPLEGLLEFDPKGMPIGFRDNFTGIREVLYNPATVIATPANRGSQRIGQCGVPEVTCAPVDKKHLDYQVSPPPPHISQPTENSCWAAVATMMYLWKQGKTTGTQSDIDVFLKSKSLDMWKEYQKERKSTGSSEGGKTYKYEPFMQQIGLQSFNNWGLDDKGYSWYKPFGDVAYMLFGTLPNPLEIQSILCNNGPVAFSFKYNSANNKCDKQIFPWDDFTNNSSHIVIIIGITGNYNDSKITILDPYTLKNSKPIYEISYEKFVERIRCTLGNDRFIYNMYFWPNKTAN